MQKKIVGILVAMLLIATVLPVTGNITKYVKEKDIETGIISAQSDPAVTRNTINDDAEKGVSSTCLYGISIEIKKPRDGSIYLFDNEILNIGFITVAIGKITIEVDASGDIQGVDIYIDDELTFSDYTEPYSRLYNERFFGRCTIKALACDYFGNIVSDELSLLMINGGPKDQVDVVINEIMSDPIGDDAGEEWMELYNPAEDVRINSWTVSNADGNPRATLPNWMFPQDTYLIVHFGDGINDDDFSDGSATFYVGDNEEIFDNIMDECALYTGNPGANTIVDFIPYCYDGTYKPGQAHDYAVTAGIWHFKEYFGAPPPISWLRRELIFEGESIGRNKDSTDTNQPDDWAGKGGKDAIAPTPGAQNLHLLGLCAQLPLSQQSTKEWTIMVYSNGDNDLEKYLFTDLDEMEQVGSDENINIVFQFDGFNRTHEVTISNGVKTPVPNTYGKTFRGYLKQEPVKDNTTVYLYPAPDGDYYLDEVNMGAPETLTNFVQWAINWFPADKYALIISDHGNGWKSVGVDNTSNEDWLYMGELKSALAPVPVVLDILGFDACLMGMMEVGYQVYQDADILVASEETIHLDGWPYNTILAGLKANPGWTGVQLATRIVNDYHTYFTCNPDWIHTLSAVNLNPAFLDLVNKVNTFADDMLGKHAQDERGLEDYDFRFQHHYNPLDNVQILVRNALLATEDYQDENFVDLFHLMNNTNNQVGIPLEYKKEAVPIMNALVKGAGVIIEEKHGPGHPNSSGLSIYFPLAQTNYSWYGWGNVFDNPWPSCITDASTSLAVYAEDFTTEWGKVPYAGKRPHPLPQTPNFDFRDDTLWDEFLHRYYKPVADAGEDAEYEISCEKECAWHTLDGRGSSDTDGFITRYIWDLNTLMDTDKGDWDKDGNNDESNDDNDIEGPVVNVCFPPGVHHVKLIVWDNHNQEPNTPTNYCCTKNVSHSDHWKTDSDPVIIRVIKECCYPSIDVEKWVWDGEEWVDEIDVYKGENVSFTSYMEHDGVCVDIAYLELVDILPYGFSYNGDAILTVNGIDYGPREPDSIIEEADGLELTWNLNEIESLSPGDVVTIEYTAETICIGEYENWIYGSAHCAINHSKIVTDEDSATVNVESGWTSTTHSGTGQWEATTDTIYKPFNWDGTCFIAADSDAHPQDVFDVEIFTPPMDMYDDPPVWGPYNVTFECDAQFQDLDGIGEAAITIYSGSDKIQESQLYYTTVGDPSGGIHHKYWFNPQTFTDPNEIYIGFWYSTEGSTWAKSFAVDNVEVYVFNIYWPNYYYLLEDFNCGWC